MVQPEPATVGPTAQCPHQQQPLACTVGDYLQLLPRSPACAHRTPAASTPAACTPKIQEQRAPFKPQTTWQILSDVYRALGAVALFFFLND